MATLGAGNNWNQTWGRFNPQPKNPTAEEYPYGLINADESGLLNQLKWAVNQLSIGYYDWREGRMNEIRFKDGATARLEPTLNAGTVAVLYYFAQLYVPLLF